MRNKLDLNRHPQSIPKHDSDQSKLIHYVPIVILNCHTKNEVKNSSLSNGGRTQELDC